MMSLLGNGESGGSVRPLFFGLSALGARVLSGMMIAVMLLVILAFVAPVVEDAQSFSYIRSALATERAIESAVKTWIPTRIAGKDMTRWIILAGMFILSGV